MRHCRFWGSNSDCAGQCTLGLLADSCPSGLFLHHHRLSQALWLLLVHLAENKVYRVGTGLPQCSTRTCSECGDRHVICETPSRIEIPDPSEDPHPGQLQNPWMIIARAAEPVLQPGMRPCAFRCEGRKRVTGRERTAARGRDTSQMKALIYTRATAVLGMRHPRARRKAVRFGARVELHHRLEGALARLFVCCVVLKNTSALCTDDLIRRR